jgi:hypothetical protein
LIAEIIEFFKLSDRGEQGATQDRARRPVDGILLSNIKARGLLQPNLRFIFQEMAF